MGTNTNAPMILGIMGFYIFLTVLLGLFGSSYQANSSDVLEQPDAPDTVGFLSAISIFFTGLTFAITGLPVWATALLFLPLSITLLYIILSWLRGSS